MLIYTLIYLLANVSSLLKLLIVTLGEITHKNWPENTTRMIQGLLLLLFVCMYVCVCLCVSKEQLICLPGS